MGVDVDMGVGVFVGVGVILSVCVFRFGSVFYFSISSFSTKLLCTAIPGLLLPCLFCWRSQTFFHRKKNN